VVNKVRTITSDINDHSQEFFETRAGDWEEHAILLCNYFKFLGKKAFVVLGNGVPEGQTCYVLTFEESEKLLLWNAATGVSYNVSDPLCPLHEIGCVFDDTNVWANVQHEARPSKMNFDFNYGGDWRPLYRPGDRTPMDKLMSLKGKLESIQVANLEYLPIPESYTKRIETSLSIQIKKNFDEWRRKGVTLWNSHVGGKLYELLQRLEIAKQNDEVMSMKDHEELLQDTLASYVVVGFPLNYAYTDAKPIIDELYNTLVYENYEKDVQFALAVYAHPYVNNVVSVWVYVTSLVSKDN
jgi:coiled-coil and C2 domain-containing protein 2A